MSAAIDVGPRGGDDPGGHTPAGAEAELQRLIHQVRTPVVQDCARRMRMTAPAPRRCVAADRALDKQRPANRSSGKQLLDGQEIPVPAPVVKDRKHASGAVAGGDHPFGIRHGECHDLVDHAVFAGLESSDRQIGVAVVGSGDDHEFNGRIGQGIVEFGIAAHSVAPELQSLRADVGVARHDSMHPETGLAADQGTVKRSARQAMADHDRWDHVRASNSRIDCDAAKSGWRRASIIDRNARIRKDLTKMRDCQIIKTKHDNRTAQEWKPEKEKE